MANRDCGREAMQDLQDAGYEMGVGQLGCRPVLLVAAASVLAALGSSVVAR